MVTHQASIHAFYVWRVILWFVSWKYFQDTIQTFYDITHREVETLELKTSAKDREMELMEDNHRQD